MASAGYYHVVLNVGNTSAFCRDSTSVSGTWTTCKRALLYSKGSTGDVEAAQIFQRRPMRVIACIEEHDVAKKILVHIGLPAEPLPTVLAQAPPVTLELSPAA